MSVLHKIEAHIIEHLWKYLSGGPVLGWLLGAVLCR